MDDELQEDAGDLLLRPLRHRRDPPPRLGVLRPGLLPVVLPHAGAPGRRRFRRLEIQVLSAKGCCAHDNLRLRPLQVVDVYIQLVGFCSPSSDCLFNSLYLTLPYDHLLRAFPNEIRT